MKVELEIELNDKYNIHENAEFRLYKNDPDEVYIHLRTRNSEGTFINSNVKVDKKEFISMLNLIKG